MIGVESVLLSVVRVLTFEGDRALTAGSGFFFRREGRLFLVSSRHVFHDPATRHFPDRIELVLHTNRRDLSETRTLHLPLYEDGTALWRQGEDSAGPVDVAALPLHPSGLPPALADCHFGPDNLEAGTEVELGRPVVLLGFPLGFYDTLHHLPVARQAVVASAYGVRFQGEGYFLTDARMHRGASGAPVLMRRTGAPGPMPWTLLGVHSARLDMGTRDVAQDERLGLNCAWYADILMAITGPDATPPRRPGRRTSAAATPAARPGKGAG